MRELRRIDAENQKLLKRISGAKPTIANKKNEEEHQAQQKIMRMRQEHGPRMPPSQIPLPFSAINAAHQEDVESKRLQDLVESMQKKVEDEEALEKQPVEEEICDEGADTDDIPLSGRSSASNAAPPEKDHTDHTEGREYTAGVMPNHSKSLVDKLMEEMEELEQRNKQPETVVEKEDAEDTRRQEAEFDRDAVVKMLAAADALDTCSPQDLAPLASDGGGYMSYENVIQRSRAALEAASLSRDATAARRT